MKTRPTPAGDTGGTDCTVQLYTADAPCGPPATTAACAVLFRRATATPTPGPSSVVGRHVRSRALLLWLYACGAAAAEDDRT
jgi:hypothetical protein